MKRSGESSPVNKQTGMGEYRVGLYLDGYSDLAQRGVEQFWSGRSDVLANDVERVQGGERDGVLAGKNMDGFLSMVVHIVTGNGLPDARIFTKGRSDLTLPGYFRPTKLWDVIVMDGPHLVAGIEFKSHVGSFGNNFNNRAEEALGTATDIQKAMKEGVIGEQARPFLGWLILVEDCDKSCKTLRTTSNHFPPMQDFLAAQQTELVAQPPTGRQRKKPARKSVDMVSYLQRYEILCRRLMAEGLYTRAALLASPRNGNDFRELSQLTGLHHFAAGLAGHVASWAEVKREPR